MTLWHLLLGICAIAPTPPALGRWTRHEVGLGGGLLLLMANLALGVAGAWLLNAAGYRFYLWWRHRSEAAQEWYAGAGFVAGIAWAIFLAWLGERLASSLQPLAR